MASARVHEAIALEVNKKYNMNELLLRLGTIAPDSWRNVPKDSFIKDRFLSHFWDYRIKSGQANDYVEFYLKYYSELNNPFYFGYLIHLIVDQYWKTYIDQEYIIYIDGDKYLKLKNGEIHDNKNYFGYHENLKMERQLSKIYNLQLLPNKQEDIEDFSVTIDELNLYGLFGENGTVSYTNNSLIYKEGDEESIIFDNESIMKNIKKTVEFTIEELEKLKVIKEEYDKKIKIAVDIDDTILCTKELEEYYWKIFTKDHPEIDSTKEYKWGDKELALFWSEYREKMAFGKLKPGVVEAFDKLLKRGYIVDLLSARPLDKYTSLKKDLTEYLENEGLKYNHINLGFYSKIEYLKKHNYDILIDNELRNIIPANKEGITSILYDKNNKDYDSYQTNNWYEIPDMIENILQQEQY